MAASSFTAAAEILPAFARGFQESDTDFSIVFARASSRLMVFPDTLRPVCFSMMEALMSSVRMPESFGSASRMFRTCAPRAFVAAARSATVSSRTK